jgi:hypothetical protein
MDQLNPEAERVALTDPHFADLFLDRDVLALLAGDYLDAHCEHGIAWLIDALQAVKANAVEIAQALLRDDCDMALVAWNSSDMMWPATSLTKMPDGTWRISGTGGQELTIYPDRLREFLLDLQRFLVNAGTRGATVLQ